MSHHPLFRNTQFLLLMCLGFSSGLPLALIGSTLQAWFTVSHVDIVTIGFLSFVGQPYILKFLWAPLFDTFRLPWFGRRRGWLLLCQFSLIVMLLWMSVIRPESNTKLLALLAFITAFFSASQDAVVDAYRTEILEEPEYGLGSAVFLGGYRISMLVSGALALVFADHFGWQSTYVVMACLMFIGIIATLIAKEPPPLIPVPATGIDISQVTHVRFRGLRNLLSRKNIVVILSFVLLYKFGEAFAVSLLSVFLLSLGFSLTFLGLVYKTVGLGATLLGAFLGGVLLTRINLYRALMLFGILQSVSIVAYLVLAVVGKNPGVMITAVFIEYFCSGLSNNAFVAFLMHLCNKRYTATHYAFLSGITAIARVALGPIAAVLINYVGWVNFFAIACMTTIPGLIILRFLRSEIDDYLRIGTEKISYV